MTRGLYPSLSVPTTSVAGSDKNAMWAFSNIPGTALLYKCHSIPQNNCELNCYPQYSVTENYPNKSAQFTPECMGDRGSRDTFIWWYSMITLR